MSRSLAVWLSILAGAAAFALTFILELALVPAPSVEQTAALVATPFIVGIVALVASLVLLLQLRARRARRADDTRRAARAAIEQREREDAEKARLVRSTRATPAVRFDAEAARAVTLATDDRRKDALSSILDELDDLIGRALDSIAGRGYAGSGSVSYASGDFGSLRDDRFSRPQELHTAWVIGCFAGSGAGDYGDWSTTYYLDDAGNITINDASDSRDFQPFDRLQVNPVYQRTTRQRHLWSVSSSVANPVLLIELLARFISTQGAATYSSIDRGAAWSEYTSLVGDSAV